MVHVTIIEAKIGLKEMKNHSSKKLVLGLLNFSSLINKFDSLKNAIGRNIGTVLISETK